MISLEAFAALSNIPVMETSRIKRLRLERGMTLADLAEKVGLSEGHMSRVETGTRGLRFAKLDKLARTLGVPVTDLVAADEVAFAPDLEDYHPPKGSVVAKALASSTQRMFRVLSGVLSELDLGENALIVADMDEEAVKAVGNGSAVIVSMAPKDSNPVLLLRQFIAPNLLITNSREQNSLPIHMLDTPATIAGVVIL